MQALQTKSNIGEMFNIQEKENGEIAISARELYKALEVKKRFSAWAMSLYLYEMASQTSMQFDVPSKEVIKSAIEQPIEFIRLMPTLQKHRDEVLKKIRMHITQGIMSGEGYSKIA
ncbi:antA/AntB antirepressor family protein, partial [Salmonella enterica subsp. enterica serovar Typhimurium]|nr:antA/AntB antirepressor family protein [Salmonella enterica subsp. enterica serovar Typhimurium]